MSNARDAGSLEAAVAEAEAWLELEGIELVAEGEEAGEPCVLVLASGPLEAVRGRLPRQVRGVPVVVAASDRFRAR